MNTPINYDLENIIENLEKTRTSLENEANYAVIWLGETIDFLQNDDLKMANWSYSKYLEVLSTMDIETHKTNAKNLQQKLQALNAEHEE